MKKETHAVIRARRILWIAKQKGHRALDQFLANAQEPFPNAWGDIYISLEGEAGRALKQVLRTRKMKEIKIEIPHRNFHAMQAYAFEFNRVLRKYGLKARHDIAFN